MIETVGQVMLGVWFVSILFKVEHWLLPFALLIFCAALLFSTPWIP